MSRERVTVLACDGKAEPETEGASQASFSHRETGDFSSKKKHAWLKKQARVWLLSPTILLSTVPFMALTPERYLRNGVKHSLQADVSRALKRALDLALSFIGLVIAIPVLSMVAIAIRMESRGPISYVQQRIGRDRRVGERRRNGLDVRQERRKAVRRSRNLFGMPFRIYKFRTMHLNAEEGSGPVWAVADDPRATRIGRYLRLIRLDEIPQFFNVLRGEMSLVGPRPERPEFVEALVEQLPHYTVRLRTKPGITGTAQINTGYDSSLDDVRRKLDHDIHYINNRSLIRDIRIILKTFWIVVTGFGAK